MKTKRILALTLAFTLLLSTTVFAAPHSYFLNDGAGNLIEFLVEDILNNEKIKDEFVRRLGLALDGAAQGAEDAEIYIVDKTDEDGVETFKTIQYPGVFEGSYDELVGNEEFASDEVAHFKASDVDENGNLVVVDEEGNTYTADPESGEIPEEPDVEEPEDPVADLTEALAAATDLLDAEGYEELDQVLKTALEDAIAAADAALLDEEADLAAVLAALKEAMANVEEVLGGEEPVDPAEALNTLIGEATELYEANKDDADLTEALGTFKAAIDAAALAAEDEEADFAAECTKLEEAITAFNEALAAKPLVIESVTAISEVVTTGGALEFTINEETEAADLTVIKEAGYTVTFLTVGKYLKADSASESAAVSSNTTGIVSAAAADTFEYKVQITKEGTTMKESAFKLVKAESPGSMVTSISDMKLFVTAGSLMVELVENASGKFTLTADDEAYVQVIGRTADMPASDDDTDITAKVDSLKFVNVLHGTIVKETGKVNAAATNGDRAIVAKAGNLEKTINIVKVAEARKIDAAASSVAPATLTLANTATDEIEVVLIDQYGDVLPTASGLTITEAIKTGDGKQIATGTFLEVDFATSAGAEVNGENIATNIVFKFEVEAATEEAGEAVAQIKGGTDVIGSVTVKVENAGAATTWELTGTKVLDKVGASTSSLTIVGYNATGLKVPGAEPKAVFIKLSNDNILATHSGTKTTILVTAESVGTTTLELYEDEDFVKAIPGASCEIEVINSTPTIANVTIHQDKAKTVTTSGGSITLKDLFTITALKDGKEIPVDNFGNHEIKVEGTTIGKFFIAADMEGEEEVEFTSGSGLFKVVGASDGGDYKGTVYIQVMNVAEDTEYGEPIAVEVNFTVAA